MLKGIITQEKITINIRNGIRRKQQGIAWAYLFTKIMTLIAYSLANEKLDIKIID